MKFINFITSKIFDMLYEGGTFLEVVNSIWSFFQDQILGMKWLNGLIGKGTYAKRMELSKKIRGMITNN